MNVLALPKLISACTATGLGIVITTFGIMLAKRLFVLCEDEGTESFTVAAGPFGILACWAFIFLLSFGGALVFCYGIYLFRYRLTHAVTRV